MKKYNLTHAIRLIILIVAAVPFIANAQDEKVSYQRPSYWRPYDKNGVNVFETSKTPDSIPFDGLRIRFGAGFTQGFQSLKHSNTATDKDGSNKLYALTSGFNTAMANLNMDVQLADGIRLNMVTYLSTRHHNEAWVKGGYLQFDKLPFKGKIWEDIMKVTTLKLGHMEINYGDAHFRRSDAGLTMYNPFVENYILDAFTTEIGGEVYLHKNGFFGMMGITNGLIKGNVDSLTHTEQDNNGSKQASVYFKAGFDKNILENVRIRVAGSFYHNGSSASNTLYGGDRAGSNYFMVMEKAGTGVTYASNAFSGRINPGFSKQVDAFQLNGFLKVKGLELFGTYENANGRSKYETNVRTIRQLAADIIYRFGKDENLFLGARYNTVKGELADVPGNDVTINRVAFAGGWFITKNILLKGELVNQKYREFPTEDYRNGGKFYGYVIQAAVGF